MDRVLCGLETEYGLAIEGRGPETQIEDAYEFVNHCPIPGFLGWDYRFESPRADMRGFSVSHLAVDPEDAKFDRPGRSTTDSKLRGDRVLITGGRFYNDHGHPEYATPECWNPTQLAWQDSVGDYVVRLTAEAYEHSTGRRVSVYKNNTDFHGASYGTHESYLVPRSIPFETLYKAITPVLVARMIICGGGKVGSDQGGDVEFQISQRADYFMEPVNVETLFRRPIFNTRDEPHADPREWRRLHVIASDANRLYYPNWVKVALVQGAIMLAAIGEAPLWDLSDPVRCAQDVSRDTKKMEFRMPLANGSYTTAYEVLDSLVGAAERFLDLKPNVLKEIGWFRTLLANLRNVDYNIRNCVEWICKRDAIELYRDAMNLNWGDPALKAADLSFSQIWGDDSLLDLIADELMMTDVLSHTYYNQASPPVNKEVLTESTRGRARALAVQKFPDQLQNACWRRLTFHDQELELPPEIEYPETLEHAATVEEFVEIVKNAQ